MTKKISTTTLILIVAIFLALFTNLAFFEHAIQVYPLNLQNILFILSLNGLLLALNIIFITPFCYRQTVKPFLILIVFLAAVAAYFMDIYHIIIDDVMIDNILETDINETLDLLSFKLAFYLFFLGLLPAFLIYKIKLIKQTFKQAVLSKLKLISITLSLLIIMILIFGGFYASFFREHKQIRMYGNPTYFMYSGMKYINHFFKHQNIIFKQIGLDAKIPKTHDKRKLIIFVVGETARADHFSLNGYSRKTNPYLEKEAIINFENVWSCGTSTAYSLPCMFSIYTRDNYVKQKVRSTANVLDILQRAGVNVLWLDNNSNSKGVADRIPFKSYKTACDTECRDEKMLQYLPQYIKEQVIGDIFIVLHQMGNHGPTYYKRYPAKFEQFKPVCKTNQLEQCEQQAVINAYDNALLYTDYFLYQSIQFLKQQSQVFETTLLYVSDHGESLGENNIYLHGLPYFFAPDAQKNVPMFLWFSEQQNPSNIKIKTAFSHDHLFHTILGLMNVQTSVYESKMDIIKIIQ